MLSFSLVAGLTSSGYRIATDWIDAARGLTLAPPASNGEEIAFVVQPGANAGGVAEELRGRGLIRSSTAFLALVELRGASGKLVAGSYGLRTDMGAGQILDVLVAGPAGRVRLVTIPEGWRAEEIARHLEGQLGIDAAELLEAVAGRRPVDGLKTVGGAASLEGYLFPDTYDFGREPTVDSVLRTLVQRFNQQAESSLTSTRSGLSPHQIVTLASIIEREAVEAEERQLISAVYHNRLARGMRLDADPTTQYALIPFGTLGKDIGYWKELSREDLEVSSPYNTYRVNGLPPGPIANPGLASIEAALQPADVPWLFFVARGDGGHIFAETLDQHLRNVAARQ